MNVMPDAILTLGQGEAGKGVAIDAAAFSAVLDGVSTPIRKAGRARGEAKAAGGRVPPAAPDDRMAVLEKAISATPRANPAGRDEGDVLPLAPFAEGLAGIAEGVRQSASMPTGPALLPRHTVAAEGVELQARPGGTPAALEPNSAVRVPADAMPEAPEPFNTLPSGGHEAGQSGLQTQELAPESAGPTVPDALALRPAAAPTTTTAAPVAQVLAHLPAVPTLGLAPVMQAAVVAPAPQRLAGSDRQPGLVRSGVPGARLPVQVGLPAGLAPGESAPLLHPENGRTPADVSTRARDYVTGSAGFTLAVVETGSFRSETASVPDTRGGALAEPPGGPEPMPHMEQAEGFSGADVVIALSDDARMDVTLGSDSAASVARLEAEAGALQADLVALGTEVEAIRVELRTERAPDARAGGWSAGGSGDSHGGRGAQADAQHGRHSQRDLLALSGNATGGRMAGTGSAGVDRYA